MSPVSAFTFRGKFIVFVIRCLLFFVHLFKKRKWDKPRKNFHEDPLKYKFTDIIYFAYKYYYNPHESFEDNHARQEINTEFEIPHYSPSDPVVSLTAAGDLMPYEWINEKFCSTLWDDIGEFFFKSEIVIANLETPINNSNTAALVPEVMLNDMEFNGDAGMFKVFNGNGKYKGFDVLSTANNHSYDNGEEGIISTVSFLENQNIKHCGTAASMEQRDNFPLMECNGIKIAFIAFTYSLNHLKLPEGKEYLCNQLPLNDPGCDLSFIKNQVIMAHDRGADIVVASAHYGNAYQLFPGSHIIDTTHRLFDECGIDIILGSHAHNIQPIEYYRFTCPITKRKKQGLASYCMGDFVAYDIFNWGHLPIWLKIDIVKTIEGAMIKDVKINPLYTCGIYERKDKRELKFLNAEKLWDKIKKEEDTDLPAKNLKEVKYLKTIYDKVFKLTIDN